MFIAWSHPLYVWNFFLYFLPFRASLYLLNIVYCLGLQMENCFLSTRRSSVRPWRVSTRGRFSLARFPNLLLVWENEYIYSWHTPNFSGGCHCISLEPTCPCVGRCFHFLIKFQQSGGAKHQNWAKTSPSNSCGALHQSHHRHHLRRCLLDDWNV